MIMCTMKCRSCFPQVWVILQIRHAKGHLQMRSSALFWYWQILQRATILDQYLWGLFSSPLEISLWEPPPYSGPNVASLLTGHWGLHLCCQPSQCLGWGDPSNLSITSSPSSCLFLLSISPSEVGAPVEGALSRAPIFWPTLSIIFILTIWNGVATSQRLWWAFWSCMQSFHFTVNSHPIPDLSTDWRMVEKCGKIIHILEKGQVDATSSSLNSSNKMGSLKKCLLGLVLLPSAEQEREDQNLDYVCLQATIISIKTNSLLYSFSN